VKIISLHPEPTPEPLIRTRHFPALLTAVSSARAFVHQTLNTWQLSAVSDDAVLIASELVTNAVLAQVPMFKVTLSLQRRRLLVEVWDSSPTPPMFQQQREDAIGGRGLFLVHELSERWGTAFSKRGGKAVWSEVALPKASWPPELRWLSPSLRSQRAMPVEQRFTYSTQGNRLRRIPLPRRQADDGGQ
jgi:anti-sigma regulatory factor (Ser/Thr protein kinase)